MRELISFFNIHIKTVHFTCGQRFQKGPQREALGMLELMSMMLAFIITFYLTLMLDRDLVLLYSKAFL